MGLLKDFKTFATKGSLADMAIGIVIGAAFGKVISAFIDGCVMPLVGLITGGTDFSEKRYILTQGVKAVNEVKDVAGKVITPAIAEVAEVSVKYGAFISSVITFLIIMFVCYMVIKSLLKKDPNAAPDPTPSEVLLAEIRDSLKK